MEVTDEELISYLDGEVSDIEKQRLEELIASDPGLQNRLATFREIDNQIADAHKIIDRIPYSPGIMEILSAASADEKSSTNSFADTQDSSWRRMKVFVSQPFFGFSWASIVATSCALALGILLGSQLFPDSGTSGRSLSELAGLISLQNPLYAVLEYSPANEVRQINTDQAAAMPVLTFRAIDARYCREFTVTTSQQGARGIACREGDHWNLELMIRDNSTFVSEEQYTTASSATSAALDDLFNALASEAPMDASSEARLIENSWKE